jgi:sensor domain CHASE-containing protein
VLSLMDRTWIAPVILALVVAATGFYFLHMAEQVRQQRLHLSLRQSVLQAQEKLTARMNQVRSVLTALEALALSAPDLTQDDFATFAAILDERFGY